MNINGIQVKGFTCIDPDEIYRKESTFMIPKGGKLVPRPFSEVLVISRITTPDRHDVLERLVEIAGKARFPLHINNENIAKEEFDGLDVEIEDGYTIIYGDPISNPVMRDEKGYKFVPATLAPEERETLAYLMDLPKGAL